MAAAAGGGPASLLLSDLAVLREKQRANTDTMLRLVDTVAAAVEESTAPRAAGAAAAAQAAAVLDTVLPKLADQHKAYHAAVSKFAKAADRAFHDGPPLPVRPHLPLDLSRVDELAALHLYREGRPEAAARLVEEAGLQEQEQGDTAAAAYEGLREIQEVITAATARGDLEPAVRWAEAHRVGLEQLGSPLGFQLARLQFLRLLQGGGGPDGQTGAEENGQQGRGGEEQGDSSYDAALAFARSRLAPYVLPSASPSPFSSSVVVKPEQVQTLMGCLLYAGRLATSPYASLLDSNGGLWQEAMETLHRDGCRLLGLPSESPLGVCYRAALVSLGPLEKMRRVVEGSRGDWDTLAELPGDLNLDPSLRFHSVFSCPVTRELASPQNPPVVLRCGHALCRGSMVRLTGRGGGQHRFKCPTCPTEQSVEDVRELFF